jgi:Matrixin
MRLNKLPSDRSLQCPRAAIGLNLLLLICFLAWPAGLSAAPICKQFTGYPFVSDHHSFYAKNASSLKPQTLEFVSEGSVLISLRRSSRTTKGNGRVVITHIAGDPSKPTMSCDTGWIAPALNVSYGLITEPNTVSTWRVEVYDEISGGPTGELPYVLDVEVTTQKTPDGMGTRNVRSALPRNVAFANADWPTTGQTCQSSQGSLRPEATLEVATADKFIASADLPQTYFVQAARYIYLKVKASGDVRVRITIAAKEAGALAFAPICSIEGNVSALASSGMIYGVIPWDREFSPLWRIEISLLNLQNTQAASAPTEISTEIIRQQDLERVTQNDAYSKLVPGDLASCLICKKRLERSKRSPPVAEAGEIIKSLTGVSLAVPSSFSTEQMSLLEQSVETAVALWIAECAKCSRDTLAMVKIGPRLLIRSSLVKPIMAYPDPLYALFADKRIQNFETIVDSGSHYQVLTKDDPLIQKLCSLPQAGPPDYMLRLAGAFGCTNAKANSEVLSLRLNVTYDEPSCVGGENVVACEADRELLEFNGRDYQFGFPGYATTIGNGKRRANLLHVMLHEVGHWLYLGHVQSKSAMMSAYLDLSQCIEDSDIAELDKAMDGRSKGYMPDFRGYALLAHSPR